MQLVEKSKVFFTFRLEGFHEYSQASNYLKNRHRHLFYFKCTISVTDQNREIEFIDAGSAIKDKVRHAFDNKIEYHGCDFTTLSCEQLASLVIDYIILFYGDRIIEVEVSEDNENGAIVSYEPKHDIKL